MEWGLLTGREMWVNGTGPNPALVLLSAVQLWNKRIKICPDIEMTFISGVCMNYELEVYYGSRLNASRRMCFYFRDEIIFGQE